MFKNKIFIFIFLFLILSFCIVSPCFALSSTYSFNYSGNQYKIEFETNVLEANKDKNYLLIYKRDGEFTAGICDEPILYINNKISRVSGYSNSYSTLNDLISYISKSGFTTWGLANIDNVEVVYTSHDICDSEGNVVFQGALSQAVTIPAIQQVGEIPQVMEQALRIVIPVGLIVFGIGLVIFLTRLVTSRMR